MSSNQPISTLAILRAARASYGVANADIAAVDHLLGLGYSLERARRAVRPYQRPDTIVSARRVAFRPERVFVSAQRLDDAAQQWMINNIKIGNISQFTHVPRRPLVVRVLSHVATALLSLWTALLSLWIARPLRSWLRRRREAQLQREMITYSSGYSIIDAPDGCAPRMDIPLTRIVGCACGWTMPDGTVETDTAYSLHAAAMQAARYAISGSAAP